MRGVATRQAPSWRGSVFAVLEMAFCASTDYVGVDCLSVTDIALWPVASAAVIQQFGSDQNVMNAPERCR